MKNYVEERKAMVRKYVERVIGSDLPLCNGLKLRINEYHDISTIEIGKALEDMGYEVNKIHVNRFFVTLILSAPRYC